MRRHLLAMLCLPLMWIPRADACEVIDVALVLAVDASRSINPYEWAAQKRGYADAFRDKSVQFAILGGSNRCIAVTMFQWGSANQQVRVIPWTTLASVEDAERLANRIESTPRLVYGDRTALGVAMLYGINVLVAAPQKAVRKVLDVSGDGRDNVNLLMPSVAKMHAVKNDIIINALPIVAEERDIAQYYDLMVRSGPGSFMRVATSYREFPIAIREKLYLEISGLPPRKFAGR